MTVKKKIPPTNQSNSYTWKNSNKCIVVHVLTMFVVSLYGLL